jgi:hypothetical protein
MKNLMLIVTLLVAAAGCAPELELDDDPTEEPVQASCTRKDGQTLQADGQGNGSGCTSSQCHGTGRGPGNLTFDPESVPR